jgi:protein AFG1
MSSFLSALKARCEVVTLDGGKDYRRTTEMEPQEKWFEAGDAAFDDVWSLQAGKEGTRSRDARVICISDDTEQRELGVYGRRVTIPSARGQACRFTFSDLCEQVRTLIALDRCPARS